MLWWYLAALVAANLVLLTPFRVTGALLLIGFLPGLGWTARLLADTSLLFRLTVAVALSYLFTSLTALLWHYLPGPIQTWPLLLSLNVLALLPFLNRTKISFRATQPAWRGLLPLLIILLVALGLRTVNLDYSEFQGDEALAMLTAAEALEGHENALWLRSKGPGEVLLPLALWRLSGAITEAIARLPFTIAALLAIVTMYLIGQKLVNRRVGWLAAGFFAFNGFMVAFGRIVQYQVLVIWLSALAFLLILYWRDTGQVRFVILGGLSLGLGLLAHYDAILVLPALGWLLITGQPSTIRARLITLLKPILWLLVSLLAVTLPFYLPFLLDPQANRTGDYVGQRIGAELRNNLPDFFHFTTFYSSFYYLLLTGGLILALLLWLLWQAKPFYRGLAIVSAAGVLAVIIFPNLLAGEIVNLAVLPFGLLFLGALLAFPADSNRPHFRPTGQALLVWLAVPFLGYGFVVALGLTHIYTTVPAWSLLAALGWFTFFDASERPRPLCCPLPGWASNGLLIGLAGLATIFLGNAFVRHDVEYLQDYPDGNLSLFWSPYQQPPATGYFGFPHRAGWKTVGQQIVDGQLRGDYGSNEEPDVTTWYTRGAPRACDPRPEFYFLADDLVDPTEVPTDVIASNYDQIGTVNLPTQKQMQLMQQFPTTLTLGDLDDTTFSAAFDRSATPAAFTRSARGSIPVEANFGNLVRLIGYDLDFGRAYPGGRLPLTLYWQASSHIPASYHVFTHLASDSGPLAQADGIPVCWRYPTELWRPGQIIADQHAILIPADIPPGNYPLQVGLYLPDTFERLDVLDIAGNSAGVSVTLTNVEIRD